MNYGIFDQTAINSSSNSHMVWYGSSNGCLFKINLGELDLYDKNWKSITSEVYIRTKLPLTLTHSKRKLVNYSNLGRAYCLVVHTN